jgi:hypothetical protein
LEYFVSDFDILYAPFNMGKFRLDRVCTKHVVYVFLAASTFVTFPRTLARNRNKDDVICYAEICYGVLFGATLSENCIGNHSH